MRKRWRLAALLFPLALVEVASYWKLSHWLEWGNEPWLAFTTSLAFVGLLLGAIVAMGLDIPTGMRQHVYIGGLWLYLVQGLANILIGYQFGVNAIPIDIVTRFFGVSSELAFKATAIIQGGSLSIVSISFWSILARMLRDQWQEERSRREKLQQFQALLDEVAHE